MSAFEIEKSKQLNDAGSERNIKKRYLFSEKGYTLSGTQKYKDIRWLHLLENSNKCYFIRYFTLQGTNNNYNNNYKIKE